MSQSIERVDAVVRGRVQGVGFRYFVLRRAAGLGLTGWVANDRDGNVRCVAEGPREALDDLVSMLRTGPAGASVADVQVTLGQASGGFHSFTVRPTGHAGD